MIRERPTIPCELCGTPQRRAGEANNGAKLNLSQVEEVRALLATGLSCAKIGAMFGLTKYPIQRIKSGKGWRA